VGTWWRGGRSRPGHGGATVVELRVLGPLEAVRDGVPVALGGHRQRAVLARLAAEPDRMVSADALIQSVWGDAPPLTARKTLQKYVSQLRKALDDGARATRIRTAPGGYVLDVAENQLDATRFASLLANAATAHESGDLHRAGALVDDALGLWNGTPYAGFDDAPFVRIERIRLDELRLAALERHFEIELTLGRHREAVAALAELVEQHPLREGLWARLMTALHRSGRTAEALRAFASLRCQLVEEVGLEPSAELKALERAILADELELPPVAHPVATPGNLPRLLTSFVGRGEEMAALDRTLARHALVTLVGPGGTGKTRLALETARRLAPRHPGGIWVADLAPVGDPARILRVVADALGVRDQAAVDLLDVVGHALESRGATLLVLDNCEHLVEAAATLAARLLRSCPELRVLATSRQPLAVPGECAWPVLPLAVPGDGAWSAALELFVDRARLAVPHFDLTAATTAHALEICRRLDGLPLAIELAASQVRLLGARQIADRLDDRFALLSGPGGETDHHRSLLATMAWSFDLLTPPAQRAFQRLGVFAGSFSVESAEAMCVGDGIEPARVLGILRELVDKSVIARETDADGTVRYRLLETLKAFALDQLAMSGTEQTARCAHARLMLELAQGCDRGMDGPDELTCERRLETEEHDLAAAAHWARDHEPALAIELGLARWRYWMVRGKNRDGVAELTGTLEHASELPADLGAWALTAAADMAANQGDARDAVTWAEQATGTFRGLGNRDGEPHAQAALANALRNRGHLDRAARLFDLAIVAFTELGLEHARLRGLRQLAYLDLMRGDYERAEVALSDCLATWSSIGSARNETLTLWDLGNVARYRGEHARATDLCQQALEHCNDRGTIAHVHLTLADVARLQGDTDRAETLYREVLPEFRSFGDPRCTASTLKNLGAVANRRAEGERAAPLFLESMKIRHRLGDGPGVAECMEGLAGALGRQGRWREAAVLLAGADGIREASGVALASADRAGVERLVHRVQAELDAYHWQLAWDEGRLLTADDALGHCSRLA